MGEVIRKTHNGKFIGWYLRYIDSDGKRKQRASHLPTFLEAKAALLQIEAATAQKRAGAAEFRSLSVQELFSRFLREYSEPTLKDRSRYVYRARSVLRRIERTSPELCKLQIENLQAPHIAKMRDALGKKLGPATVRSTLFQLSAVLSWAVGEELLAKNPAQKVAPPRAAQPSEEWLQPAEARRLLEAAQQAGQDGGALWQARHVGIALGLFLGLRLGEIYGLRWRDVDFRTGRVTVARSYGALPKSGRARHLKMPAELRALLETWHPRCPKTAEEIVVPVCRYGHWRMSNETAAPRGLPSLFRAAGLKPFKRPWHALRHTFATNYLRQGGSIAALQRLLGHASVTTTMIYAHMAADHLDAEMERVKY